jgi:hypothetical protein
VTHFIGVTLVPGAIFASVNFLSTFPRKSGNLDNLILATLLSLCLAWAEQSKAASAAGKAQKQSKFGLVQLQGERLLQKESKGSGETNP